MKRILLAALVVALLLPVGIARAGAVGTRAVLVQPSGGTTGGPLPDETSSGPLGAMGTR